MTTPPSRASFSVLLTAATVLLLAGAAEAAKRTVIFAENQLLPPVAAAGAGGFLVLGESVGQIAATRVEKSGGGLAVGAIVRLGSTRFSERAVAYDESRDRFLACWSSPSAGFATPLVCRFLDRFGRPTSPVLGVAALGGGLNRVSIERDPVRDRWIVQWNEQFRATFGSFDRLRVLNGDGSPAGPAVDLDGPVLAYDAAADALLRAAPRVNPSLAAVETALGFIDTEGNEISPAIGLGGEGPVAAHAGPELGMWLAVWARDFNRREWAALSVPATGTSAFFGRGTKRPVGAVAVDHHAGEDLYLLAWAIGPIVPDGGSTARHRIFSEWRQPDGTSARKPFRVAPRKGAHGKPAIACAPDTRRCLVVWQGVPKATSGRLTTLGRVIGAPKR